MRKLTAQEREAIRNFQQLAATWPSSLTLLVSSDSCRVDIIDTPKPGDATFDDLHLAESFAIIRIPTASCS